VSAENDSRASSSLLSQAGTPQQSLGRSQQDTRGHSLIEVPRFDAPKPSLHIINNL